MRAFYTAVLVLVSTLTVVGCGEVKKEEKRDTPEALPAPIVAEANVKYWLQMGAFVGADVCTPVYVDRKESSTNYMAASDAAVAVKFAIDVATAATLYKDAACTEAGDLVTMAPGSTSAVIYVKPKAETLTVTVTATANDVAVNGAPVISVVSAGSDGSLFIIDEGLGRLVNTCSRLQLGRRASNSDQDIAPADIPVTFAFEADSTAKLFSDPACVTEITSATLAKGTALMHLFLLQPKTDSYTLTITPEGATPITINFDEAATLKL